MSDTEIVTKTPPDISMTRTEFRAIMVQMEQSGQSLAEALEEYRAAHA